MNIGFHNRPDGFLYCDDVRVADVHHQLMTSERFAHASPAFVYSRRQIENNVREFYDAFRRLPVPAKLHFSMKSNYNIHILKLIRSLGCGVTLVSGTEMQVALAAGFEPRQMVFNGSGKEHWEIAEGIKQGVLLNVDSPFDLTHITDLCHQLGEGTTARVLLRVNLDIDSGVHMYLNTGASGSKFGLDPDALSRVTSALTSDLCPVRVEGLHCHLGSNIKDTGVFRESVTRLLALREELKAKGFSHVNLINVGGGLPIDYERYRDKTLPFREEPEEVILALYRLKNHLVQQVKKMKGEGGGTTCASDHLCCCCCCSSEASYHNAVQILDLYIQEKISRAELDQRLWKVLQGMDIAQSVAQDFSEIWATKKKIPTPADLIDCLRDVFVTSRDDDVTLLFEPGRAIVGNAGTLMTSVIGFKASHHTKFLVVDGAMNDVIRPSLYGAYHFIHPASPPTSYHPSSPTRTSPTLTNPPTGMTTTDITNNHDHHHINITSAASATTTTATTITPNTISSSGNKANSSRGSSSSNNNSKNKTNSSNNIGSKGYTKTYRCPHCYDNSDNVNNSEGDDDVHDVADDDKKVDDDDDDDAKTERKESGGKGENHVMDIVGPVCECGDFLGKNRLLPLPVPGACVVMHDAGAYCSSQASNYNLRMRAAEVLVDGSRWHVIRRPDNLQDLLAPYSVDHPGL
ncbi:hypothetical protein ACOMHN_013130 [Nucella lapillus]